MQTHQEYEDRMKKVARRIVLAMVVLVMAILGVTGSQTNWFGLAPRFRPSVQYEFQYTMKSTVPGQDADGNNIAVATRQFVVDQTTMFPAAESGLVEDASLPPNTFVFQEKTQPAIVIGRGIVRGAYGFIEVRYHQETHEKQTIVPHLKPPQ